ncbi:MAG: hypothetical protein GY853_01955 [PVC group bacterium]|nr:hypothetical protein [PVC group bacterium]
MAKFLIYNKIHYYELPSKSEPAKSGYERNQDKITDSVLTPSQKIEKQVQLTQKYDARSQQGDIVEIRKDDAKLCGKEPLSFALIDVPEIKFEEAVKKYHGALIEEVEGRKYLKRQAKSSLDISGIILNKEKEATINLEQFNNLLTEKDGRINLHS